MSGPGQQARWCGAHVCVEHPWEPAHCSTSTAQVRTAALAASDAKVTKGWPASALHPTSTACITPHDALTKAPLLSMMMWHMPPIWKCVYDGASNMCPQPLHQANPTGARTNTMSRQVAGHVRAGPGTACVRSELLSWAGHHHQVHENIYIVEVRDLRARPAGWRGTLRSPHPILALTRPNLSSQS